MNHGFYSRAPKVGAYGRRLSSSGPGRHRALSDSQTETPRLVVPNPLVRPDLGLFWRPSAVARSQGNYWV
ncbi:nucleoside diphosphate kinase 3 [Prunus yedoensis var. nudiflora]|uniref:Nucleoside diphosphate kinase 3 n=1 Tax=Prunus yedoensis var. nudiflora TaxID=2094558 RepID=A0A314ZQS9_PRUYE|nr:nucleoside diphosphate kinase 3 [Prunus yedoensis var. nudiflora]